MIRGYCYILLAVTLIALNGCRGGGSAPASGSGGSAPVSGSGGFVVKMTEPQSALADTIPLGKLFEGEHVTKLFSVENNTSQPMVMISYRTSCGCVELELPKEPIAPGGRASCQVTLYSAGYGGWFIKDLYITTSLSSEPVKWVVEAQIE